MAEGETWDIFKACPISHWCRFGFLVIQWPLLWYVTSRVTPLSENEILHTPCHHHLLTTLQDAGEHQSSEFFPISPPKYLPSTAVAKSWERHKTIFTKYTASVFRMAIRIYYRMLWRANQMNCKVHLCHENELDPPPKTHFHWICEEDFRVPKKVQQVPGPSPRVDSAAGSGGTTSAELAQEWQQAGVRASTRTARRRLLEDGLVSRRAANEPLLFRKNHQGQTMYSYIHEYYFELV